MNTGLDCWNCTAYLDENAGRMEYMRAFHPQKAETVSAILRELFDRIHQDTQSLRELLMSADPQMMAQMLASQLGGQQPQSVGGMQGQTPRSVQPHRWRRRSCSCAHCSRDSHRNNPECTSAEHDGWNCSPATGDAANATPGGVNA